MYSTPNYSWTSSKTFYEAQLINPIYHGPPYPYATFNLNAGMVLLKCDRLTASDRLVSSLDRNCVTFGRHMTLDTGSCMRLPQECTEVKSEHQNRWLGFFASLRRIVPCVGWPSMVHIMASILCLLV